MAKTKFPADRLRYFLQEEKIATLEELKRTLGTTGTMTVFRKLKELGYLSSYSHRGKYYTLHEIPDFDEQGLWDWHAVWFSRYGNLVETAREFVLRRRPNWDPFSALRGIHLELRGTGSGAERGRIGPGERACLGSFSLTGRSRF